MDKELCATIARAMLIASAIMLLLLTGMTIIFTLVVSGKGIMNPADVQILRVLAIIASIMGISATLLYMINCCISSQSDESNVVIQY